MSLGSELAPHLPFLRRYARALTGSQTSGDYLVRATLEDIVANPDPTWSASDPRKYLYRKFTKVHLAWQNDGGRSANDRDVYAPERTARRRLAKLSDRDRAALLLTSLERFSEPDAAEILDITPLDLGSRVKLALLAIEKQTKSFIILITDNQQDIRKVRKIIKSTNHVLSIAIDNADARRISKDNRVDLIISDIYVADGPTFDTVAQISSKHNCSVIYLTSHPQELLSKDRVEPTFLVTKPYQDTTLGAAIAQAIFFDNSRVTEDDYERVIGSFPSSIPAERLIPRLGPVDATVLRGVLVRTDGTSDEKIPATINTVRRLHLSTVRRLIIALEQSNSGYVFRDRVKGIECSLAKKITRHSSLQLAIQAKGLRRLISRAHDELSTSVEADLTIFADDLVDLSNQFETFREFLAEARRQAQISEASLFDLKTIGFELASQDDSLVGPSLKAAIIDVGQASEEEATQVSHFALLRTVSNVARAIGRYMNERWKGIAEQGHRAFDKTIGRAVGVGIAGLILIGPVRLALSRLAETFPLEFPFIDRLIELARAIIA